MRHTLRILATAIAVVISSLICNAQENDVVVQDLEGWTSIEIEKRINKAFRISLGQSFRLSQNSTHLDKYFTYLGIEIRPLEGLRLGFNYRFLKQNDSELGFENKNWYHFDVAYKHEIDRLALTYRIRYQNKNDFGLTNNEGDTPTKNLRFRIKSSYNIPNWKFDPELSGEIFRTFESGEITEWSKFRMTLGTQFRVFKQTDLKAFYRYEKELVGSFPQSTYILGLKFTYNL